MGGGGGKIYVPTKLTLVVIPGEGSKMKKGKGNFCFLFSTSPHYLNCLQSRCIHVFLYNLHFFFFRKETDSHKGQLSKVNSVILQLVQASNIDLLK